MKKHCHLLLLLLIFIAGVVLRFNSLRNIPNGLQQDETSIGYNAYSILNTGRDEYGVWMPLYFKAFGEYKLPGYIYGSVLPIKIFGLTAFGVRFFSAFTGSLTILGLYLFVHELLSNRRRNDRDPTVPSVALISSLMLAINPWHIHFSRGAFEVTPALFFLCFGVALFLRGVNKQQTINILLGVCFLLLSVYIYNIARILAPVIFLYLFITNYKSYKGPTFFIPTVLISILILLPFILSISSSGGLSAARSQLIYSSAAVQASLLEYRSYMTILPQSVTKIFFNSWNLTMWQYIQNIAAYLSVPFFFISGSGHGNHGIGTVGQFYLFELPLVIIGLVHIVRTKSAYRTLLLIWGIAVIAVASLTREAPQATRSFFLLVPMTVFSAMGLIVVSVWLRKFPNQYVRSALTLLGLGIISYNVLFYLASYYIRFPVFYAKAWRSADKDVSMFIKEHEADYDKIIFDKQAGFMYTSLLFFTSYPPVDFQRTSIRMPDDSEGFSDVVSFGKYEFREIDRLKDYSQPNTLIITTSERKPFEISPLVTFYYPKRPLVFAIKQQVISYPVEEIAYVAVASNR